MIVFYRILNDGGEFSAMGGDPASKGGQIMQKFGERIRKLLTKFWIWIVTITLFAIGITGTKMTFFRIMYTGLALIFVVTFQVIEINFLKRKHAGIDVKICCSCRG